MPGNTLTRLGFAPDDRVTIVHADDLGMCHAANVAFWEDQAFGIVTCGSVMMPCPWASEMAAWCRAHPEADVGVHITLNAECSVEETHRHMDPDAARAEMRAQVEHALALGIDVTHIDTHMGTVIHPQLSPAYIELALEYRIPALLLRVPESRIAEWGIAPEVGYALLARLDGGHGFSRARWDPCRT